MYVRAASAARAPNYLPYKTMMTPILNLFEAHLTVRDLDGSMVFFGDTLGLRLAQVCLARRVAFYWIGMQGQAMLGIWESPSHQPGISTHIAFLVDFTELMQTPERLRAANVIPRDFEGMATSEPVVLAWMPAAALYFHDPDNNLLEFLSMLPESPRPDLGVVGWSQWAQREPAAQTFLSLQK